MEAKKVANQQLQILIKISHMKHKMKVKMMKWRIEMEKMKIIWKNGNSNIKSNFSKKKPLIRIKMPNNHTFSFKYRYFEITPDSIIKIKMLLIWKLKQIREMHKRIYHFRQSAIEIFL
ncbi:hypothetical protein M0811_11999 [Anaeramoeba ignava]|uniref:BEACH-type PH domain-containing protein n=1 Tax=Anaeramoeba ignava TaxID=1746090 RepID=A0A9Q0L9T4_ANAIG|nr:hypothetical protein M0811_11999 [Anaeramoeba ignava]